MTVVSNPVTLLGFEVMINNNDLAACMTTFKAGATPKAPASTLISVGRYNVALAMARKALAKATPSKRKEILQHIRMIEERTAPLSVVKLYTI